jgi:hypothetical protein
MRSALFLDFPQCKIPKNCRSHWHVLQNIYIICALETTGMVTMTKKTLKLCLTTIRYTKHIQKNPNFMIVHFPEFYVLFVRSQPNACMLPNYTISRNLQFIFLVLIMALHWFYVSYFLLRMSICIWQSTTTNISVKPPSTKCQFLYRWP